MGTPRLTTRVDNDQAGKHWTVYAYRDGYRTTGYAGWKWLAVYRAKHRLNVAERIRNSLAEALPCSD